MSWLVEVKCLAQELLGIEGADSDADICLQKWNVIVELAVLSDKIYLHKLFNHVVLFCVMAAIF